MRAEPPPPSRRDRQRLSTPPPGVHVRRVRCQYLEQILRERAGPFGMLNRFKADCHVDRRTHRFTGRNPMPPCINDPSTCELYQRARGAEDDRIRRYLD